MSLTPPSQNPARQPSLFSTEAADPSLSDLAGLLAGPGEVVRMGGTARVAVVVDAAWRCTCWWPSWAPGDPGELGADGGRSAPGAHRVRHHAGPARPGLAAGGR